jgi:hypothetical protein
MSGTNPTDQFTEELGASFKDQTFVRLVLFSPVADGPDKVFGRLVDLKGGPHLSLTFRYATREVTKNPAVEHAATVVREQLWMVPQCAAEHDHERLAVVRPRIRQAAAGRSRAGRNHNTRSGDRNTLWIRK